MTLFRLECAVLAAVFCAAALVPGQAQADVVVQDTFSGSGQLNGRAPSVTQVAGATWTDAAGAFKVNAGSLAASGVAGQAQLPIKITAGAMYDLSADITCTGASLGIGFQQGTASQQPNGLGPWAFLASNGNLKAYAGPGATYKLVDMGPGAGTHHIDVQLDTRSSQWTVNVIVDNVGVPSGSYTYPAGSNPVIDHVAVTGPAGAVGTISNFVLTASANPVVVAINCGASTAYQGSGATSYCGGPGTLYSADRYFSGGSPTTMSTSLNGIAYSDQPLYQSFRAGPCLYNIPLPNGPYTVILGYCETTASNVVGSRVFNVAIQGKTVLPSFDILANNRHPLTPVYMTFNATVTNGMLTIAQSSGTAGTPVISTIVVRKPPRVPTKIACGEYQLFHLVNGQILAAGSNRCDEGGYPTGVGNCYFPSRPIAQADGVTFADVACGGYHSIALDSTDYVWAWGGNGWGQMGNGTTTGPSPTENFYTPHRILTDINGQPFNNVKQIGSGFSFNAALKNDGTIWVWGSCRNIAQCGDAGIIGNGDLTEQDILRPRQVPVFVPSGVTITQISAGNGTMMALDSTGAVWSWGGGNGWNSVFDRGTMITPDKNFAIPTKIAGALAGKNIASITNGAGAIYAVDSNHNLYCWGYYGNMMCQGTATATQPISYPVAMNDTALPGLSGHVQQVVTSWNSTHVLLDDGTMWGWGYGCRGEVGDGNMQWGLGTLNPPTLDTTVDVVVQPVKILSGVANVYASIQGGSNFAVKTDGSIWSWGFNKPTYLGNGIGAYPVDVSTHADYFDEPTPTQVCPY